MLAEDYLRDYLSGADSTVLVDLVYQEYLLREELEEAPTCDEYRRRFPQLADQLREQIEFHHAVVASAQAANDGNVESPLAGQDVIDEVDPARRANGDSKVVTASEPTGIWMGPYRLLQSWAKEAWVRFGWRSSTSRCVAAWQ